VRASEVVREQVDGVPVFRVKDGGPTRAALVVRTGRIDETLPSSGITHLVEHLSLYPFGQQRFQYNALVDPIRTVYYANGGAAEMRAFLTGVTRNLNALPIDRLTTEARVLREESRRRPTGPFELHAWLRFGCAGAGLMFLPELGLYRLTEDDARAWSSTWFTSGNSAVIWMGPDAPDLALELGAGLRHSAIERPDLIDVPVWVHGQPSTVAISFRVGRSSASAAVVRIFAKRLQQRLRYDRGIAYDVQMTYQPVGLDTALAVLSTSSDDEHVNSVHSLVSETVDELCQHGPTAEELEGDIDTLRRQRDLPSSNQAEADRLATQELLGAPSESFDALEAQAREVTPDTAAQAMRRAADRAILTLPEGATVPSVHFRPYPNLIGGSLPGEAYFNAKEPAFDPRWRQPRLVVGSTGISVIRSPRDAIRISFSESAAAVLQPDGALIVVDKTGAQIGIDKSQWWNVEQAQSHVLDSFPADRQIRIPAGGETTQLQPRAKPRSRAAYLWAIVGSFALVSLGLGLTSGDVRNEMLGFRSPVEWLATPAALAMIAMAPLLPWFVVRAERFQPSAWRLGATIMTLGFASALLLILASDEAHGALVVYPLGIAVFASFHVYKVRLRDLIGARLRIRR
jgi:zinc protease